MPVNKQDRNKQFERCGGNCGEGAGEDNGSPRGEEIANTPAEKLGETAPGRREFRGHGNASGNTATGSPRFHGNAGAGHLEPNDVSLCKHDQPKDMGKKFVGGKLVGPAPDIPSEVQVSERRHGAGNNPDGGHEHQTKGKERISADINRN